MCVAVGSQHLVEVNRNPAIAICHSLGCSAFDYFLKWMEKTEPKWREWCVVFPTANSCGLG